MRIVIDCNVFVSAALGSKTCRAVVKEAFLIHEVFYSKEIIQEIDATFEKFKLAKVHHKKQEIISVLKSLGKKVKPRATIHITLPDPYDVIYLQTALTAPAAIIITGNKKHFPKSACDKIQVLSPRQFLELK